MLDVGFTVALTFVDQVASEVDGAAPCRVDLFGIVLPVPALAVVMS